MITAILVSVTIKSGNYIDDTAAMIVLVIFCVELLAYYLATSLL